MRENRSRRRQTRWEEDNRLAVNPWAILVAGLLVGGIAALVLVFELLV